MRIAIMPVPAASPISATAIHCRCCNLRLGPNNYQTVEWNEKININEATVSLHPAGHIIGSSQVRVEYKGEVWVVSGDFKIEERWFQWQYLNLYAAMYLSPNPHLAYLSTTGNHKTKYT